MVKIILFEGFYISDEAYVFPYVCVSCLRILNIVVAKRDVKLIKFIKLEKIPWKNYKVIKM